MCGRVEMGDLGSRLRYGLPKAVNSIGAVSPAMRETDRIMPVRTPGAAARRMMEEAMRQVGMPRACPASRRLCGTR